MPTVEIDYNFWSDLLSNPIWGPLLLLAVFFIGIIVAFFIFRRILITANERKNSFDTILLLVEVPQLASEQKAGSTGGGEHSIQQIQEKISVMETFLSALAGLKAESGMMAWLRGRKDVFSFELVSNDNKILFYISCLKKMQDLVEDQLNAQFPAAVIAPVADYNIFKPDSIIDGRIIKFKREFYMPVKTYKKMDSDPLNSMINALGQVDEGDGVAIQIVFRSAPKKWHDMGSKVASKMQQGMKYDKARKEVGGSIAKTAAREIGKFADALFNRNSAEKDQLGGSSEHHQLSPMEQEIIKGLEEKTSKAGVEATIRVIAASSKQSKSENYLNNITNSFTQYNIYQYGNAFTTITPKLKNFINDFIYRSFEKNVSVVLNTEELASLFHFPLASITEHPAIHWLEARQAPAPLDLPKEGIILGENVYRGVKRVIRITPKDRRRHIYEIGKTGSGKSYMMTNWMLQDLKNGSGMCVMDPHGELADDIIKYVPKERAEDVIYFDPSDVERPMAMNLLEFERPEQKTFVVNELLNIFDKLYDLKSTGGPMFELYFRNAVLLVMEDPDSGMTLLEIPRVLADEEYRAYKLSKCKNQTVKDFWQKEAEKAGGEASLANMVPYITSKLTQFISNDYMRPIIAQQTSAFSFREAMDQNKIILCNLSKGKIGSLNSDLLGMVIVGKLLAAALSRVDVPEEERNDFFLFIDEFQNYLTEGISIILSEARKYRLCLHIAHQFIGQLTKNNDTMIRDAIFGNVGTFMSFRVGPDDAELFAKQYSPVFSEFDVMNVPKFQVFTKLLINNQNPPAFNMRIPARDKPEHPEIAEAIKELSRLKYGKDRDIIEAEVLERTKIDY
ncbi:hypothetical protein COT97_04150 [Candidatus Falkowbacteria bacterium CG10_big_fil_rev_8_21_14_0_10_39_11]|uniref:Type IV secretion system coupling protein TraD DNA-binding domain-containing protein n=1 Tax=Candidatus Falkowbacteria bacterium CG10_big_fil_rev_8_21_14_0_10_39_11 TaxID=1974565 RepID=A0A2H0V654_9BACT|nr:MAG: hypothetical protein COT97_04150 [Candidatus Falkowbacteria bacterium CG10_big_fil_rev_8_21_14_0_10_39_11]